MPPPHLAAIFADGDDEIDQTIRAFRLAHGLDVEPLIARDDVADAEGPKAPVAAPAAPVVAQVFADYARGVPVQTIADRLNTSGVRTVRGYPFTAKALNKILKSRTYVGE